MATFDVDLEDDVRSPTTIANGMHHERTRSSAAGLSTHSRPSMDDFGSEDGDDRSVEDEIALLGSGIGGERQLRGRELSEKQGGSMWTQVKDIVVETAPTLLLTTVGLLFTGELLDHVSHWKAMQRIDELIIIIPVILNLKGNLEMNLSSRLGTAANVGELDERKSRYGILSGNMALLQVQATLVSFISALMSFVLGLVMPRTGTPAVQDAVARSLFLARRPRPPLPIDPRKPKSGLAEFIMVASTGMASACLSSLILGSFMCTLVVFCRKFALNPDNIAPPVAACLGDLVTLCLLGLVSTFLINFVNTPLPLIICVFLVVSTCVCAYIVSRNHYVRGLIKQGWSPLFGAMAISCATGIILDLFVSRYSGFALLAVVISGLPGAVGSVAVSRISTSLHAAALTGHPHASHRHENPPQPSFRIVTVTLFLITIPVEICFLTVLRGVGWLQLPVISIAFSLVFFCITVLISLWIARVLTEFLWRKNRDPDIIPDQEVTLLSCASYHDVVRRRPTSSSPYLLSGNPALCTSCYIYICATMTTQPLSPYTPDVHPPLRNPLLAAPHESVPAIDELEATHAELAALKRRALERAKKAAGDLKIIEHEMKKMREMEKGKARALPQHRVKREQSYTPSLDQDERNLSPASTSTVAPSSSTIPSINVSSVPQKLPPEIRKIKKKRKRDDESDGERDSPRPRKLSPNPPALPQKEHHIKHSKLNNVSHAKAYAPDWSLPQPPHHLLPQRPVSIPSLPPCPRKPIEVKEDFSKAKAPASQVPITTFYTSIEPWLRQVREEDVGWLEYDGDTIGPYVFPELGRHYTEQWEDEDVAFYGGVPAALDFSASRNAASISNSGVSPIAPLPKWDVSTLNDNDLSTDKGLGPVSERLVTALLPAADQATWKSTERAEEAYEAKIAASGSTSGGPSPPKEKVLVADFEERVKDTIRFYGLLDGEFQPDFSNVVDDPIAIALRQCQRQLREASATNKVRRKRLAEIARDRLAYQEYVDTRDVLDKNIQVIYTKLQRKDGPKVNKKKKKGGGEGTNSASGAASGGGANGMNGTSGSSTMPLPNPASLGLGPDEDNALVVPEQLRQLVETRQQWVEVVGGGFEEEEQRNPGRFRGVPQKSVFEGVEEEVKRELGASAVFLPPKPPPASAESAKVNGERAGAV
ncbi:NGG1 [Sanghuangporus vaninii]